MKKKSVLLVICTLLFFNVNTMFLVKTRFLKPLSLIEKELLKREIRKRGITTVRKKVENNPPPTVLYDNYKQEKIFSVVLTLETIFYKKEIETNPVAAAIFKKIKRNEKKSGYIPEQIMKQLSTGYKIINPTNFVGPYTRYYRLSGKDEGVLIKSEFYNKDSVMKTIETYKE